MGGGAESILMEFERRRQVVGRLIDSSQASDHCQAAAMALLDQPLAGDGGQDKRASD
jgi:hypothetical protein